MRRLILAFFVLATGFGAWAQAYDPQVAYVRNGGSALSIVLANLDGSKAVTVYTAPSKTALASLSVVRGGGRIAFVQKGALKVLDYTATNSGIAVSGVTTLVSSGAGQLDFSPDGSRILYVCEVPQTGQVSQTAVCDIAASGAGAPRMLLGNVSGTTHVAWHSSGTTFFYVRQFKSDLHTEVRVVTLNEDGLLVNDTTLLSTALEGISNGFSGITGLDTARTRDSLLLELATPSGPRIVEYVVSGTGQGTFIDHVAGTRGHFSSDDGKIVFRPPHSAAGDFVSIFDVQTGTTSALTKKGSYGDTDARP